jgi:hypothetical protein
MKRSYRYYWRDVWVSLLKNSLVIHSVYFIIMSCECQNDYYSYTKRLFISQLSEDYQTGHGFDSCPGRIVSWRDKVRTSERLAFSYPVFLQFRNDKTLAVRVGYCQTSLKKSRQFGTVRKKIGTETRRTG